MKKEQKYKTAEQIEFIDLMDEMKERFGFNATKVAEIADITSGMVSQIRKGTRSPGKDPMRRLREKYQELTVPGAVKKEVSPHNELHDKIVYLEQNDPVRMKVAEITVDALYRDARAAAPKRKRKAVSSDAVEKHIQSTVEFLVQGAEARVKHAEQSAKASAQIPAAPSPGVPRSGSSVRPVKKSS